MVKPTDSFILCKISAPDKKELNMPQCVENHRKSFIPTLQAKRATFTFRVDKSQQKMPILASF